MKSKSQSDDVLEVVGRFFEALSGDPENAYFLGEAVHKIAMKSGKGSAVYKSYEDLLKAISSCR